MPRSISTGGLMPLSENTTHLKEAGKQASVVLKGPGVLSCIDLSLCTPSSFLLVAGDVKLNTHQDSKAAVKKMTNISPPHYKRVQHQQLHPRQRTPTRPSMANANPERVQRQLPRCKHTIHKMTKQRLFQDQVSLRRYFQGNGRSRN